MTLHEFQNVARRLRFVDCDEIPGITASDWFMFRTNPVQFLIDCDDETARKIWRVVGPKETA